MDTLNYRDRTVSVRPGKWILVASALLTLILLPAAAYAVPAHLEGPQGIVVAVGARDLTVGLGEGWGYDTATQAFLTPIADVTMTLRELSEGEAAPPGVECSTGKANRGEYSVSGNVVSPDGEVGMAYVEISIWAEGSNRTLLLLFLGPADEFALQQRETWQEGGVVHLISTIVTGISLE